MPNNWVTSEEGWEVLDPPGRSSEQQERLDSGLARGEALRLEKPGETPLPGSAIRTEQDAETRRMFGTEELEKFDREDAWYKEEAWARRQRERSWGSDAVSKDFSGRSEQDDVDLQRERAYEKYPYLRQFDIEMSRAEPGERGGQASLSRITVRKK